jgi:DNA-binding NarL/FixJ family response regulator
MSNYLKTVPPDVALEAVRLIVDGRRLDQAKYLSGDAVANVRRLLEEILKPSERPALDCKISDLHADGMDER